METPAKGIKGFLLQNPDGEYIFRVYSEDRKTFTDYDLVAHDIEIELLSNYVSLYNDENPRIDYSSQALGKHGN